MQPTAQIKVASWPKKLLLSVLALFLMLLSTGCSTSGSPNVKKSTTGICHEKGTNYYKNTKTFDSFSSIEDCLNSGGKLSKK